MKLTLHPAQRNASQQLRMAVSEDHAEEAAERKAHEQDRRTALAPDRVADALKGGIHRESLARERAVARQVNRDNTIALRQRPHLWLPHDACSAGGMHEDDSMRAGPAGGIVFRRAAALKG